MITEKKVLSPEPVVGENSKLVNVKLGDYTEVGLFNFIENVVMEDYSYTGQFCFVQNAVIGKFANIAAAVRIGPTMHPVERPTLHHFTYRREMYGFDDIDDIEFFEKRESRITYIGKDTWIGHGAIIMPRVSVGDGAVVGSGAVVTKDVEPYTVVAGVPARFIKRRFPEETARKLQSIKWWDWPHEKIKENFKDFLLDIDAFIDKHYEE
ncbi:MAG: chloramphenicol acetyltransferase [Bacillota bacterium]|nr:chloramphenicol acetyltransferase [Bacillota bacterium]